MRDLLATILAVAWEVLAPILAVAFLIALLLVIFLGWPFWLSALGVAALVILVWGLVIGK